MKTWASWVFMFHVFVFQVTLARFTFSHFRYHPRP